MIELIHISLGFSSLVLGSAVLVMPKGTKAHRLLGRFYFISMLGLNLSSFGIYSLFNAWGFFHWMAVASLIPLVAGFIAIKMRRLRAHFYFMCWSYIGLLCATISEIFVHVPIAVSTQELVPHIDSLLMLMLVAFGFYYLPKVYQNPSAN